MRSPSEGVGPTTDPPACTVNELARTTNESLDSSMVAETSVVVSTNQSRPAGAHIFPAIHGTRRALHLFTSKVTLRVFFVGFPIRSL